MKLWTKIIHIEGTIAGLALTSLTTEHWLNRLRGTRDYFTVVRIQQLFKTVTSGI